MWSALFAPQRPPYEISHHDGRAPVPSKDLPQLRFMAGDVLRASPIRFLMAEQDDEKPLVHDQHRTPRQAKRQAVIDAGAKSKAC